MASYFRSFFSWITSFFFSKHAEISIVGLQASGKSTFVHLLGWGEWTEDIAPTVAFDLRTVKKNNVTIKIWDLAGQPKFRSMWERYCKGIDAIVFVVDSADREKFNTARVELEELLKSANVTANTSVPLLVLANKSDINGHAEVDEIIDALQLQKIQTREVSCSMKSQHNLETIVEWLAKRGH